MSSSSAISPARNRAVDKRRHLSSNVRDVVREAGAILGDEDLVERKTRVSSQVEGVLLESRGHAFEVGFRGGDATRSLPEDLERKRDRGFELFRTERKEKGQNRILEQSSLDEIGAGESERREIGVKGRVVPERDGDGLVVGQTVRERDADRNRRLRPGRPHRRVTRPLLEVRRHLTVSD